MKYKIYIYKDGKRLKNEIALKDVVYNGMIQQFKQHLWFYEQEITFYDKTTKTKIKVTT